MKRIAILVGGVCLLALGVSFLRPVVAQAPNSPGVPLPPIMPIAARPPEPQRPKTCTCICEEKGLCTCTCGNENTSSARSGDSAYDLLKKLACIRAKKAELEKAESATLAQLKLELDYLHRQSQIIGLTIDRDAKSQPVVFETPPPPLAPAGRLSPVRAGLPPKAND